MQARCAFPLRSPSPTVSRDPTRRLSPFPEAEAPRDCPLCPRLVAFRQECRAEHPDWWNAPVPAFGDPGAWLAIVGLAPGKHGANRTGRPFTGDYAGELLYATLRQVRAGRGRLSRRPRDGLQLRGAIILNAVKCLPPRTSRSRARSRPAAPISRRHWQPAECARADCAGPDRARRRGRALGLPPSSRNSATAPSMRRPTAASCCRAITARATTRTPAGSTPRCSRACSSGLVALAMVEEPCTDRLSAASFQLPSACLHQTLRFVPSSSPPSSSADR